MHETRKYIKEIIETIDSKKKCDKIIIVKQI